MNDGIIVLRMHRSGTSLLTRALEIMGADLGKNVGRMHFENIDIRKINIAVLESLDSNWMNVKDLPLDWVADKKIEVYKKDLKEVILRNFQHSRLWAVKDPRICLLLPMYLDVFTEMNIDPFFVVIERENIEIAKSLAISAQILLPNSLKLCYKYKKSIDTYSKDCRKICVKFDDLINDSETTLKRIRSASGVSFNDYNLIKKDIDEFIDPKLKHHNVTPLNYALTCLCCLIPRNMPKRIDRKKGEFGIYLRRHYPRGYKILKKLERT